MAEVMFELALKADPVHTIKFIYASKIYQQIITSTKDFDYSLDNSIREGYQNAYRMLVLAQMEQKKYPQAVLSAQRAMQSGFEDNGFFLYYQGRASLEAGEFQKASQFLAESIRRNPKDAEAFRYLGITLNQMGQEEAALKMLQQAALLKASGQNEEYILKDYFPRVF